MNRSSALTLIGLGAIGRALVRGGELRGVLTHAGGSYAARGAALQACAEEERKAVVDAAYFGAAATATARIAANPRY